MTQIVGNAAAGIGGQMLGLGPGGVGQMVHLFGSGDPNANTDPSVLTACIGSLWSRGRFNVNVAVCENRDAEYVDREIKSLSRQVASPRTCWSAIGDAALGGSTVAASPKNTSRRNDRTHAKAARMSCLSNFRECLSSGLHPAAQT